MMEWLINLLSFHLFDYSGYTVTLANILIVIVILIGTSLLLRVIRKLINSKFSHFDKGRSYSLFLIAKYFIWVISILICIQSFGINLDILIAGSAALFVGIGFGLQNIFNDFISGIILLLEGTISVDDVVEVDGQVGKVIQIKLRTTTIITREDIIIIVPNHKFVSDNVTNWSHHNVKTRFRVDVGVAYGSDVRLVERCLLEVIRDYDKITNKSNPRVLFRDFGSSSLDFSLVFWSEEVFRIIPIQSEIRFRIVEVFRKNNIEIPFPQRDLHIKSSVIPVNTIVDAV
jgi:small-conductance mechanosensitive channel